MKLGYYNPRIIIHRLLFFTECNAVLFLKFVLSKKATKIDEIFTVDLTLT